MSFRRQEMESSAEVKGSALDKSMGNFSTVTGEKVEKTGTHTSR